MMADLIPKPTWSGTSRVALATAGWLARAAYHAAAGAGLFAVFAAWFLSKPGMLDDATAAEVHVLYGLAVTCGAAMNLLSVFYTKGPNL